MKKILLLLIAIIIGACSSKKENNEIIVAMELQYPPFETIDSSGNPSGISVEIASDLADNLNKKLVVRNTSWVGLIPTLQNDNADLILSSMSITEDREKAVDFSLPYAKSWLALLLNKQTKAENFNDLNSPEYTVVVKSGTVGANLASEKLPNAKVKSFENLENCILEVAQGKADVFIYDPLTIYENYKKYKETTKMNLQPIEGTLQYWAIAVKKGNGRLLNEVNKFLLECKREGKFKKISDKYLSDLQNYLRKNDLDLFWDI